jgi:hypothetical protein
MALLATFRRTRVRLPGVSIDISSGEEPQFEEVQSATAGVPFGYYLQIIFEMKNASGAFTTRERGLFGLHYVNTTSGSLDTSWTTADYTAVESAWDTFFTGQAGNISTDVRLVEYRWYAFGANVVSPNPPARVLTKGTPIVGTATGDFVHQVAWTVTLRTALRRHWGRIYVPWKNNLGLTGGQTSSASVDSLAAAARTALLAAETAQGVVPVIWDRNRKLAFTVTAIEMDSVPDIIRRRRPRDTSYKKIYTA